MQSQRHQLFQAQSQQRQGHHQSTNLFLLKKKKWWGEATLRQRCRILSSLHVPIPLLRPPRPRRPPLYHILTQSIAPPPTPDWYLAKLANLYQNHHHYCHQPLLCSSLLVSLLSSFFLRSSSSYISHTLICLSIESLAWNPPAI